LLPLVILGLFLLVALVLLGKAFVSTSPAALANGLRYGAVGVLGLLALFLLLTGRFALGAPLAAGALALLRRWQMPSFPWGRGGAGPRGAGRTSEVQTAYLRMTLEHDSGAMRGTVLRGAFAGSELDTMTQERVLELREACRIEDPESVPLLESYLDRRFGAEWRGRNAGGAGGEGASRRAEPPPARSGRMGRAEALEVLGLAEDADAEKVRDAHRRLMVKLHPDKGGSDYLAAKINEAKDVLLAEMRETP